MFFPGEPWTLGDVASDLCSPSSKEAWTGTCLPNVYVATIAANHNTREGRSVGKHNLVIRFLRGAQRLNPPRPRLITSWNLNVVLQALQTDPFEPLQSVEFSALDIKMALLTALTSVKRVGNLQAFSVNESCLVFEPADSHVVLRLRPGYVPKVPTTPFRD